MRQYFTTKNIPAIVSLFAFLLALPATIFLVQQKQFYIGKAAENASLTLAAPKIVGPGQKFTVEIKLDTGNRSIPTTGTDVILEYDSSPSLSESALIEPLKITPGNTYDTYPIQEIDTESQTIRISGSASSLNKYFTGAGTFASIEFQALQVGSANLRFVWREGATNETNIVGLVEGQPQERLTSQPAMIYIDITEQTLSWVNMHTNCQLDKILDGDICDFSALAYTANNQPIWSGVRYEWGISSDNSIGTLSQVYGNMTQFKAQNPGEGDVYVIAKQGDLMEAAGRHLTVIPRPPITPSPLPSPSPPPTCQPETLNVPFNKGTSGTTTVNYYQDCLTIGITGVGQASGKEWSDAFYVYTDSQGNPLPNPIHYTLKYNWTLWINGRSAEYLIPNQEIPPYNSNHTYNFTVCLPEQTKLIFGVGDIWTVDNTGAYTILTCGPISPPTKFGCWKECSADDDCFEDLNCLKVDGVNRCANPDCPEEKNCICPLPPQTPIPTPLPSPYPSPSPTASPTASPTPTPPALLNFSLFLEGRGPIGFATNVTIYGSYTIDVVHAFHPLGSTQTDITGSGTLALGNEHIGRTYKLFARTPSHLRKASFSAITIQEGSNYVEFGNLIPGDLFIPLGGNEQDNLINNFDVAELFQKWGPTGTPFPPAPADLNGDGAVNTWDLKLVFDNFGRSGDNP